MMKKAKIVTYCTWQSIGSVLQALALKKFLVNEGVESVIILNKKDNEINTIKVNSAKSFLKRLFEIVNKNKKLLMYKKRMEFIQENLVVQYFVEYNELFTAFTNDNVDIYIAGSDQIWHPDNCIPLFFLDFVQNKKCISYAASMGKTQISIEKIEVIREYLKKFEYISVREQACVDVLEKLTDREINVNIDPTFLISSDEWRNMRRKYNGYKVKKSYILLYMLYWDNSYKEKIKCLKKKTGLPVYAISNGLSGVYADKVFYDVGVEEFLWLIDNAKYVITSSFHGVAFSILFRKKFAAVINPNLPSRIENLLKVLAVPHVDIDELDSTDDFAYDTVSENIKKEQRRSIEYLREAIG